MKKSKKPQQREKEKAFSPAPFSALKNVALAVTTAPGKLRPETPVPPPKAVAEPDDSDMFLRAMSGVKQLDTAASVPRMPRQAPVEPRKIDDDERLVFLKALEELQMDVTFVDELPDDQLPLGPLPVNRMRQLRRGSIRIDYELDLHGLTREEALESLVVFLTGAHKRGQKAVLVITGKGNNSPGEPVLLGAVSGWLRDKGKGVVAEFFPAPRMMGGGGAFVVFLKDKDKA